MKWIIGIDEVGRGPLAGPVSVCAVLMEYSAYKKARWQGLTDSKKMSARAREVWYAKAHEMKKTGLIRIGIAHKSAAMIDTKGISWSIRACIKSALGQLGINPSDVHLLLDGGLKAPEEYVSQVTVIRGDQKHKIISLASVVAKVTRDAYMTKVAQKYPGYRWETNKGYGTKEHVKALKKSGMTSLHRKSFLGKLYKE